MVGHVMEHLQQRAAEHAGQITGTAASLLGVSAVWLTTLDIVLKIVASILTIIVASLTLRTLLKKDNK